ncbi:hypothetical protein FNH09_30335 [Streptomyces adustus]|uniref:Uncharacterized protein n=1 Tax=Streptomyces adustus TaxID=1609272 RepID=A0A5N8VJI6_9ACTN|nr:hypothetical protein [Streptomyces adustus]MPY35377.1 hypothetical protein [Streptomyces adustus]
MSNGAGRVPEHRPRTAAAHRIPQTLWYALTALLAACLVTLGTAGPAEAAPSADDLVKVFVVQDPAQTGGQLATLQSIAAATLGDAARADEIFQLNRGQAQQDGSALGRPGDQLHPGWILRLPQDASGPGVQLAKDTGGGNGASAPPAAGTSSSGTDAAPSKVLTVSLGAALALLGAILLALITAGIVARRKVRTAAGAVGRGVRALGAPVRRRRRLAQRQAVSRRFDADGDSVQRAYNALGEFTETDREPEKPVHALGVDDAGVTVWLSASDTADAPWANVDGTRWRRPADAPGLRAPGGGAGVGSQSVLTTACLVRAGTDAADRPVFVDLSRLDGVLSVGGDRAVARDVVQNLLAEIARTRPNLPVTVVRGSADALPLAVPPNLRQMPQAATSTVAKPFPSHGTVRAAASRRPVRGLVVVSGTPGPREAAELAALCSVGWTGLVCGETQEAHWRWYADGDGHVDIPVLDLQLTVPA